MAIYSLTGGVMPDPNDYLDQSAIPTLNQYSNVNNQTNITQPYTGLSTQYAQQQPTTLQEATDYQRQVMRGADTLSQQLVQGQTEEATARAAAQRGALSQQAQQLGLSQEASMLAQQRQQRESDLARQQQQATLQQQLIGRADTAAQQLGALGIQEEQLGLTREQMEISRQQRERELGLQEAQFRSGIDQFYSQLGLEAEQMRFAEERWRNEFGLQKDMSEFEKKQWADQFGLSVDQFNAMQEQWKTEFGLKETMTTAEIDSLYQKLQLDRDQLNMSDRQFYDQLSFYKDQLASNTQQFYDRLNLDKEQMDIARQQWTDQFGLEREMSEFEKQQWADQYGLSVAQFDQMQEQWKAEHNLQEKQFTESASQWAQSFGFQKEQYQDAMIQQALENGWTEQELTAKLGLMQMETIIGQEQANLLKEQVDLMAIQNDWANAEKEAQLEQMYQNISLTNAQKILLIEQVKEQAIISSWTNEKLKAEIANIESATTLTDAQKGLVQEQKTQMENEFNIAAYEQALLQTDYTNATEVENLKAAYETAYGTTAPSFDLLIAEAQDVVEGRAAQDLASYVSNYREQFVQDDGTFNTAGFLQSPGVMTKVEDLFKAQTGRILDINNPNDADWVNKTVTQMALSPTQLDRQQALNDFKSTQMYQTASQDEQADMLKTFYELDYLAQTGGMKMTQLPDGSVAMVDSAGNLVYSKNDYTNAGNVNGKRYVTDQSGNTFYSVTLGGEPVDVVFSVEGQAGQYSKDGGKTWVRPVTGIDQTHEDRVMIDAMNAVYGDMGYSSSMSGEGELWFEYITPEDAEPGGVIATEEPISVDTPTNEENQDGDDRYYINGKYYTWDGTGSPPWV